MCVCVLLIAFCVCVVDHCVCVCVYVCVCVFKVQCVIIFMLSFIQIFLIRSFLEYLSKGDVDIWVGLAYVGGVMVCELMRSISISISWIINYQAGQQALFCPVAHSHFLWNHFAKRPQRRGGLLGTGTKGEGDL